MKHSKVILFPHSIFFFPLRRNLLGQRPLEVALVPPCFTHWLLVAAGPAFPFTMSQEENDSSDLAVGRWEPQASYQTARLFYISRALGSGVGKQCHCRLTLKHLGELAKCVGSPNHCCWREDQAITCTSLSDFGPV